MIQILKIYIALILSVIFLPGCSISTQKLDVSGLILEFDTKQPVPYAEVQFGKIIKYSFPMATYGIFHTVKADMNGKFSTTIDASGDVDIYLGPAMSSNGATLFHDEYKNKKRAYIIMYGSLKLKGMDGNSYVPTYE